MRKLMISLGAVAILVSGETRLHCDSIERIHNQLMVIKSETRKQTNKIEELGGTIKAGFIFTTVGYLILNLFKHGAKD